MLTQPAANQPESSSEASNSSSAIALKPNQLLSAQALNALNVRSNVKGGLQLAGHLAVMGISGYLWATQGASFAPRVHFLIALPALILYGVSLAAMFAPMHESCHRTAFASNSLNDGVAWFAGLLSFYNSAFYRRYHKWHHRYTQIPEKDPELSDRKPQTFTEYLVAISGFDWWIGKVRGHVRVAFGNLEGCPYIPDAARSEVIRSTRLQLLVYGIAIALSIAYQQPWFLLYWLLPLAIGQPVLRAFLLAEHTGCTYDDNALTNTRTTLTIAPFRWLMWNMPFHAEHHLYASIPFHALPAAHDVLQSHFTQVDQGYMKVNREIIAQLGSLS